MSTRLPNILLLTIDCWRADYLGAQNGRPSLTPNIDRLVDSSYVFTQAITCGGWTRPSITALLSSTFASMYGGTTGRLAAERPSLSEALQSYGYTTAGFTTNPQIGRTFGFERGFDTFVESEPDGSLSGPGWAKMRGAKRLLCQPVTHRLLKPFQTNTLPPEITTPAEQLCDQIGDWLEQPRQQPAFVWAHFMDVHWPYHNLRKPQPALEKAKTWRDLQIAYQISENGGYTHPGDEQVERFRELYRQAIVYVDEQIGRLVERLKAAGLWEDTVLILTADHGEEFYEHGRWSHYQLYDESLRVPLVVRIPGIKPRSIDWQVSLLDVAPTVLELAGVSKPEAMLGISLLQQARESQVDRSREVYAEAIWPDNLRLAIRTEEFKFLYESKLPDRSMLIDLKADPGERENIYAVETAVVRRFEELRKNHEARAYATASEPAEVMELDALMSDRLRALGYIE